MQYFLFVPTESNQPEMVALTATDADAAVGEAELQEFGGRIGYLFDGDRFVQEISTAAGLITAPPLSTPKVASTTTSAPPRPG